jgi:calcium-dependent protein kinase
MLQKEIELLRKLDHPNVLRLYESFEDGKTVYLVMELCKGGDLFERISDSEHCAEKYCSQVAAQICGALAHCHDQGVCHRDLKPENLLLLSQAEDAPIKVADFGLAKHLSQGNSSKKSLVEKCREKHKVIRRLKTFAGTLEYMAPEVIRIKDEKSGPNTYYDFRCDTWSFGVIVHMMLKGTWPFKLEQVAAYVAEDVPLPDVELSGLSSAAKDFISLCLQADFKKRPYPADLLKHPFIQEQKHLALPASISPMGKRFQRFAKTSSIKKAALTAAVRHLKGFEVEELRTHFELFDVNRDGTVTLEEFQKAVAQWPKLLPQDFDSAEELFQALDSDSSGQISYTEFLAAAMDVHLAARDDLARGAFDAFDQTGVGEVTGQDIQRIMFGRRQGTKDLAEIGITKGEGISFECFREHLSSP